MSVILFLMAAGLAVCYLTSSPYSDEEPLKLIRFKEEGAYCYLDVEAMDDWTVRQSDKQYFLVKDSDGYYWITAMLADQHQKLLDENPHAADSDDHNWQFSQPVRMTGTAKMITKPLSEGFMKVYDLSQDRFNEIFGLMYLDGTERPLNQTRSYLLYGSIGLAVLSAVSLLLFKKK